LSSRQNQAIFTSASMPLGECRLEGALSAAAADDSSNATENASGTMNAKVAEAGLGEPFEVIQAAGGRKINLHRNNSGDICAVSLSGEVKNFDSVDEARSYFRN
jgi:hypothetical protein